MRGLGSFIGLLLIFVLLILAAAGVLNILTPVATAGAFDPTFKQCLAWVGLLSTVGAIVGAGGRGGRS